MQELNETALERTLTALGDLGRLEQTDEALVALCRSTAKALDGTPGRAGLVQQYRECLQMLMGVGSSEPDGLSELLADIGRASVGDTEATGT